MLFKYRSCNSIWNMKKPRLETCIYSKHLTGVLQYWTNTAPWKALGEIQGTIRVIFRMCVKQNALHNHTLSVL